MEDKGSLSKRESKRENRREIRMLSSGRSCPFNDQPVSIAADNFIPCCRRGYVIIIQFSGRIAALYV